MTFLMTPNAPHRVGVDRTRLDIDPVRWPDVAVVPAARVRAFAARALVQWIVRDLPLRIALRDGRVLGAGKPSDPLLRVHRPEAFYRRVGAYGLVGFGESYMAGDWDADDLTSVLEVFAHRLSVLVPPALQRLRRAATLRPPSSDRPARGNSRNNVARHYDLSNELFATFLDPTMTYSSALFPEEPATGVLPDHASLVDAQRRKIDRLLDLTGVRAGSRVLEIGTGWGELALRAAERGADVTSITLSEQQRDLALRRIHDAGVADLVRVELCDYRDVQGSYDAVLSVEMIEAVGLRVLADVFQRARRPPPTGRESRLAGHHHAARPDAGDAGHLHLDPEIHLPWRLSSFGQRDRADGRRAHLLTRHRSMSRSAHTTQRRCACGGRRSRVTRRGSTGWASMPSFAGCGRSTWLIRRRVSVPDISTCNRSSWKQRAGDAMTTVRTPPPALAQPAGSPRPWTRCAGKRSVVHCRYACGHGTVRRPDRTTLRRWCCAHRRRCAGCSGIPVSWAWPRHTSPATWTSRAISRRDSVASGVRSGRGTSSRGGRKARQWPGLVKAAARIGALGLPPAAPQSQARLPVGCTACAGTAQRSAITTTSAMTFTRCSWIRRWRTPADTTVRTSDRLARNRAARQTRPRGDQAGCSVRQPAPGHRLRLGVAVAASRRALRGARHRGHALSGAAGLRSGHGSRSATSNRLVEVRLQDYREVAGRRLRQRLVASRWASTSARTTIRPSRGSSPTSCVRRAGRSSSRCRGAAGPAAAHSSNRSSRPTCTCGRSARP